MHVAPGFVDLHTHYDAQGFGTRIAPCRGGTGLPLLPLGIADSGLRLSPLTCGEYAMKSMVRVEAIPYESMAQDALGLGDLPEYLNSLDRTPKQ